MTPDLTQIEARAREFAALQEAATGPEWLADNPGVETDGPAKGFSKGVIVAAVARGQNIYVIPPGGVSPERNKAFIIAARNTTLPADTLALVARVRELEALVCKMATPLESMHGAFRDVLHDDTKKAVLEIRCTVMAMALGIQWPPAEGEYQQPADRDAEAILRECGVAPEQLSDFVARQTNPQQKASE